MDKSLQARKKRFVEKYDGTNPAESKIEARWNKIAKLHRWTPYKFTSPQRRGVPDRFYCRDGEVFFIEFKRLGLPLSPTQVLEHEKLKNAGMTVLIIDVIDDQLAHAIFL